MNIICEQESLLTKEVLEKMSQGAKLCVQAEGLDESRIEVSLTIVCEEEIRQLNREYRDVDKVTDVLSFPQYEDLNQIGEEGEIILGDVVICKEQALRQADEYGHSARRELVYLFVHSICHLLGYDHMNETDKLEMRREEERVMSQIGMEREEDGIS